MRDMEAPEPVGKLRGRAYQVSRACLAGAGIANGRDHDAEISDLKAKKSLISFKHP